MKTYLIVLAAVAVVLVAAVYFVPGLNPWNWGAGSSVTPAPTPTAPNTRTPSNGGNTLAPSGNTQALVDPNTKGVIEGLAKPVAGVQVDLASVKVALSDFLTGKEVATASLDVSGHYKFTVAPGKYTLGIVRETGTSKQLPQSFSVFPGDNIGLNFQVSK